MFMIRIERGESLGRDENDVSLVASAEPAPIFYKYSESLVNRSGRLA